MDQLRNIASKVSQFTHLSDAPTSNQLRSSFESVMGPLYQPKTGYGRVAHTVGEYSSALIGPGMLAPKLAAKAVQKLPEQLVTRMVAPAIGSEGAGYLAKDTKYEPQARIVGAMLGGGGATNTAREIENASARNALGRLNTKPVMSSPLGYPTLNASNPAVRSLPGVAASGGYELLRQLRKSDDAH
jgi:hypothetical protein